MGGIHIFAHDTVDANAPLSRPEAEIRKIMIVEYTRYKIDENRHTTFESDYKKAVASLEASSHCLAYELSHCTEDPNHYVLRIEWDSEEGHLKGFRSSPEFKSFLAAVQPYVKDIEEMRHYQVISNGAKAGGVVAKPMVRDPAASRGVPVVVASVCGDAATAHEKKKQRSIEWQQER